MLEKELDEIRENIDKIREDRRLIEENVKMTKIELYKYGKGKFWQGFFLGVGITEIPDDCTFCLGISVCPFLFRQDASSFVVGILSALKDWKSLMFSSIINRNVHTSCLTCCALYLEGVYRSSRCESKSEIRSENEIDREAYFDIGKKEGLK